MLQSALPQSLGSMTHIRDSLSSNLPASDNWEAGGTAHSFPLYKSIAVRGIGKLEVDCLNDKLFME